MNHENQQTIILILGLSMNITLIGLITIIVTQGIDYNEVLIFSSIITTIIGILGGFLTGNSTNTNITKNNLPDKQGEPRK